MPRDYYLTTQDVRNIAVELEKLEWKWDKDQATSVQMFTERNPENVLFYQPFVSGTGGGQAQPFQIAWSSPDLLSYAAQYGDKRVLSMDSTFATNNLKVNVLTAIIVSTRYMY